MLRAATALALLLFAPTVPALHGTTGPCAVDAPQAAACAHVDRTPTTYDVRFLARVGGDEVAGGGVQGDAVLMDAVERLAEVGDATGLYSVDREAFRSFVAFFVWEVDTAAHRILP